MPVNTTCDASYSLLLENLENLETWETVNNKAARCVPKPIDSAAEFQTHDVSFAGDFFCHFRSSLLGTISTFSSGLPVARARKRKRETIFFFFGELWVPCQKS